MAIAPLNIHQQARSRSRINHARHTTFYSAVEASSVTPFFRAVDRELADRDLRIKTKETGFLHHNLWITAKNFRSKPGFWPSCVSPTDVTVAIPRFGHHDMTTASREYFAAPRCLKIRRRFNCGTRRNKIWVQKQTLTAPTCQNLDFYFARNGR